MRAYDSGFKLENKTDNLIDIPKYANRIDELRGLSGNKSINIYKYDRFAHSRMVYEKSKKINHGTDKWKKFFLSIYTNMYLCRNWKFIQSSIPSLAMTT